MPGPRIGEIAARSALAKSTPRLTRRGFLAALLLLAGGGAPACTRERPAGGRPNLLVLVSDDQRADTLGCMGNPVVRTPNLDALAGEGALFERAFVTTSVCPSSRASIFTGQLMRRHGVHDFSTSLSSAALAETYPVRLRLAGYRTGFLGKWGVGTSLPRDAFDVFGGFAGQGHYLHTVGGKTRHLTELLASQAIEFLESHPGDRPFCLSVSFKAPHGPWSQPDPALPDPYADVEVPLPESATPEAARRLAPFLRRSLAGSRGVLADPDALRMRIGRYYRLVTGVDVAVGRLVEALERLHMQDDTVVVFTSDNGLLLGEQGLLGKWLMYEPSIRVPLVVRDPRLPQGRRGRRLREMALNVDLAPTLLDLAGLGTGATMQGRSLAGLLRGDAEEWREDWFYESDLRPGSGYLPVVEGVRGERWKLVRYLDPDSGRDALYDLANDPLELDDRIGDPAARPHAEHLLQRWRAHREALGSPPEPA